MAIFNLVGQEVVSSGSNVIVDDELSTVSENPIKNKAVAVSVNTINSDISTIDTNIDSLTTRTDSLDTSVEKINTDIITANSNITAIDTRVTATETNIDKIELCADYEVGDWDSGDVWYAVNEGYVGTGVCTATGPYHLSYDYCTVEATIKKVIGWQTIYYSLPVACTWHIEFQITATDGKTYNIKTTDKDSVPVVEISCSSGNMTGSWGDSISFTLRYKYK